ncbi:MAG: putative cytokinetic ring protein SteA [Actinomycetota bacterium]|nr:putative cytokinetic ring protein SteA [Acidimicrobiales bacterium]MEC8923173.1 putative cytokinetic ring protein SteA [Actinomycetota bacterium]MEE3188048.1 putative cytokinetic ring protein SteA [Actinomycetota bacterium]
MRLRRSEGVTQGKKVAARARVDRRTKNLIPRLQPGEIAVINHRDLDRVAAEGLVAAKVSAVLNASQSMSGRYPALGALVLVQSGVPLIDGIGVGAFNRIQEGDKLSVIDDRVYMNDQAICRGSRPTVKDLEQRLELAREAVRGELGQFATNTLQYLATEPELITDDLVLPELSVELSQRQILVVVRGIDYREDLAALRRSGYMREMRPILVGVDGGADALLEVGVTPDLILGDFDSVSRDAITCGAQLLVHAYPGGLAPGAARLDRLGVGYSVVEGVGTSEDIAMRMAFEERAELIVLVGSHTSMADFFDKGRRGMASTFLTRMKVSAILVDAKGVSRLYRTQVRKGDLGLLILSALFTLTVIAAVTEPVRLLLRTLWLNLGM